MPNQNKKLEKKQKIVTVKEYKMHGHCNDQPLDYYSFFKFLSNQQEETLHFPFDDKGFTVYIPYLKLDEEKKTIEFIAYTSDETSSTLVFDIFEGTEKEIPLSETQVLAVKTHGLIDCSSRICLIEYAKQGVKAENLAIAFEQIGREKGDYPLLTLAFSPIPSNDFGSAVDNFERIIEVNLFFDRPNTDWADHAHKLFELGSSSGAHSLSVGANAPRGGSLSPDSGIVGELKKHVNHPYINNLSRATVKGVGKNNSSPQTINIFNYPKQHKQKIPVSSNNNPQSHFILSWLTELMKFLDLLR